MRRAEIVTVLAAGLLVTGLSAGCGGEAELPSEPPSASTATTSPTAGAPLPAPPLPLPQPQPPTPPIRPEPGLDARDRALLAQARRIGAQWVVLLVGTEPNPPALHPGGPYPPVPDFPGPNSPESESARADRRAEAIAQLEALGGVIGTSSPGPGYLRVTMPTVNVERAAALPSVTAVDVEQVITPHHPRPAG